MKRYTSALSSVKESLALNPKNGEALCYRGICYYKLHNTLPALHDFKKAAELAFTAPLMLLYQARTQFATGDYDSCVRSLLNCEKEAQNAADRPRILLKLGSWPVINRCSDSMDQIQEQGQTGKSVGSDIVPD